MVSRSLALLTFLELSLYSCLKIGLNFSWTELIGAFCFINFLQFIHLVFSHRLENVIDRGKALIISKALSPYAIVLVAFVFTTYFTIPLSDYLLYFSAAVFVGINLSMKASSSIMFDEYFKDELIFYFVLFIVLLSFSFDPSLFGGEKMMDLSLLSTSMVQNIMPLRDPWFGEETLRYYYLGPWVFGNLGELCGIEPIKLYGLILGWILASFSFCCEHFLRQRFRHSHSVLMTLSLIVGAPVACLLVIFHSGFAANGATVFWEFSRFYDDTFFAEFPLWTWLFADLHSHVYSLPLLAAGCFLEYSQKKKKVDYFIGFISGILFVVDLWGAILFCTYLCLSRLMKKTIRKEIFIGLGMAMIIFFPFMLQTYPKGNHDFPLHFGFFLQWKEVLSHGFFLLLLLVLLFLKKRTRSIILFIGLYLIFSAVSIHDPVNTFFKSRTFFYWFFLCLFFYESKEFIKLRYFIISLCSMVGIVVLVFGLRGHSIQRKLGEPFKEDELKIANLLKSWYQSDPVFKIIELGGNSFEYQHSRMSSLSGVPAVLGWKNHVSLRGYEEKKINQRWEQVKQVFKSSQAGKTYQLLQFLGVRYVILGPGEKSRYQDPEDLKIWWENTQFFKRVYSSLQYDVFLVRPNVPTTK